MEQRDMTMLEALNSALDSALAKDEKVLLLGEDIGDPAGGIVGVTAGLSTKYGHDRVRDAPISEAAILGAAVGAGLAGYRPVAEIMFVDLLPIALDQILNHAAKMRFMTSGRLGSPLTIRSTVLGGMGMGTGATHGQTLEAWFMHIAGLKVVIPSTPADAKGLLTSAIFDDDPVLFIETGALYGTRGPVPTGEHSVPLGKANVARSGDDITIISYGLGMPSALAAADTLQAEGISAEVIDLRTLLPVDFPTVFESVAKTRRAIVVHYATRFAGPGAELAATITEQFYGQLVGPVARIGAKFVPIPQAPTLEQAAFPQQSDILDAARRLAGISSSPSLVG